MTSINISIKEEAYNFLKSLKAKNKSFSDIILGFKSKDKNIMSFFGVLKNKDWKEKESSILEFRKSFNRRLK